MKSELRATRKEHSMHFLLLQRVRELKRPKSTRKMANENEIVSIVLRRLDQWSSLWLQMHERIRPNQNDKLQVLTFVRHTLNRHGSGFRLEKKQKYQPEMVGRLKWWHLHPACV